MSFSSNRNRVKDESLPLQHRASHARSCALHVANKLGVNREAIINLIEQQSGVSLHQPRSSAELLVGFSALEALRSGKAQLSNETMETDRLKVLSAHPIAPEVRQRVMQALADIEAEHDVTVLYACESGSRGWGFASPDSDYDVRFLYVHRLPWYLAVEPKRDVIELPINDELDVGGWELRKALRLLRRANPVLLEWLDSPVVYREDTALTAGIRELATQWFSPKRGRYHYLAMAHRNFRGYLQGESVRLKKYLYVLRPLLAAQWIERGLGQPPMRFADLAERLVTDAALLDEINALLEIKMRAGESEYSPRWPRIHAFIESELARTVVDADYKKPEGDTAELDAFLMRTVLAVSQIKQ